MKCKLKNYVIAILIPLGVGIASSLLTMENMGIYSEVNTPPLSPPSWLFPVAWTVLYILMGISSALVWCTKTDNTAKETGLAYYIASLIFNFGWSIIFFNLRAFFVAFAWLCVLWILILFTVVFYARVNKTAAYLQLPYLVWVTFAGYLNIAIALLN